MSKNEEMGLELLGLVNLKEKLLKDKEEDRIKHMQVGNGFSNLNLILQDYSVRPLSFILGDGLLK